MTEVAEVMARPLTQLLLRDEPLMRLAYTGLDGAPRVIPLAYLWDGTSLLFWTVPISAKVRALQADPLVAVTIDVIGPPPRVLLARGHGRADDRGWSTRRLPAGLAPHDTPRGLGRLRHAGAGAIRADGRGAHHPHLGEATGLRDHRAERRGTACPRTKLVAAAELRGGAAGGPP